MNVTYFISQRILKNTRGSFAFTVTKIATFSIAIGLAILICSYSILKGFNAQIQDKIFALSGHLQITRTSTQNSLEDVPMNRNTSVFTNRESTPSVAHIYPFIRKPAIVKTKEGVQGVLLKGIDQSFANIGFQQNLVEGSLPTFLDTTFSRDIVISKAMSQKMRVGIGDECLFYFIQNPPKFRKVIISGVYETGMEELDHRFVLCDLKLIQGINQWNDTLIGGYEMLVNDFSRLDDIQYEVFDAMDYDLSLMSVKDQYAQIFDWFRLLQNNVEMLMIIILFIICINVGTSFVIIILEKIRLIGSLKAFGAQDQQIRKVFLLNGLKIISKGLIGGNVIGFSCCALQYYLKIVPLDEQNYYVDHVPILVDFGNIMAANILLVVVAFLSLLIPGFTISRISPIRSIRMQ